MSNSHFDEQFENQHFDEFQLPRTFFDRDFDYRTNSNMVDDNFEL